MQALDLRAGHCTCNTGYEGWAVRHIMSWLRGDYLSNRQIEQKIAWWKGWLFGWVGGILFMAIMAWPSKACAQTIGLHLYTVHDTGNLESSTPGVYVKTASGLTAGAYRNSYRLNSVYAGWTWSKPHSMGDYSLTAGVVTGYPAGTLPMLSPSARIGPVRLTLIPKVVKAQTATGVHFSVEWSK